MCYTYETSIKAFVINLVLCLGLLFSKKRELKVIALFFIFVSSMQLFDAYFWVQPKNERATKTAMIFNHLQPLVLAFLLYMVNGSLHTMSQRVTALYLAVILVYTARVWPTLQTTRVTEDSNGSLNWMWNHGPYSEGVYILFMLTIMVLFYTELSSPLNKYAAIITLLSYLYSIFKYMRIQSSGRFWCFFTSFLPLLLYVFY